MCNDNVDTVEICGRKYRLRSPSSINEADAEAELRSVEERAFELNCEKRRLDWTDPVRWAGIVACFVMGWFVVRLGVSFLNTGTPVDLRSDTVPIEPVNPVMASTEPSEADIEAQAMNWAEDASRVVNDGDRDAGISQRSSTGFDVAEPVEAADFEAEVKPDNNRARMVFRRTLTSIQTLNDVSSK